MRREFEQYRMVQKEVWELEEQLVNAGCVTDVVTGSSPEYPHIKHSITISGVDKAEEAELVKKLSAKMERIRRVHRIIQSAPNDLMRSILTKRYVNGWEWEKIARYIPGKNGEDASGDAVRKRAERYLDGLKK